MVAVAARADSAPIEAWHLDDDPDQWFFVVRPRVPRADRAVLVSVHGINRDAWEHARLLQPWAQRYAVTLICPHFTRQIGRAHV